MATIKRAHRHQQALFSIYKPIFRAYCLGFLFSSGPRLLKLLSSIYIKGWRGRQLLVTIYQLLAASSSVTGLPVACGALVGGYTLIQLSLQTLLEYPRLWLVKRRCRIGSYQQTTLSRFTAAFTASWLTLLLLNVPERHIDPNKETLSNPTSNQQKIIKIDEAKPIRTIQSMKRLPLLGETLDLTLLVSIRALDTVIAELWSRHKASRMSKAKWTPFESVISLFSDTGAFVFGCSLIMWAWFYLPERLPRTYNEWIGEAAQVDSRLIETLRKARFGEFVYGLDTGQAGPLQSMCEDYDWPLAWGDPAQTIPIPCEVVHMGAGPSCHRHAIIRFFRAFKFALIMYLPIQLLAKARTPSMKSLKQAVQNALRSSAFLGAFISLFYYSVCLSRTILGPKIFRREQITPMMWDSGLCVKAGCMMCGWSILIETPKRRQEFSLFVAPRALATLLPRKYQSKYFWREQLAFSLSIAVLFTVSQENPRKVRGVVGHILHRVLE